MRSQFLTLLCILTFLSCALGLIDAAVSFVESDAVAETPYIQRTLPPEEQQKKRLELYEDRSSSDIPMPGEPDRIRTLAIAQFIYTFLTLVGAILMFRLRRIGFWIYLLGVAAGIILPLALVGADALNTSFGVFFSILFAILYGFNLREMH